MSARISRKGEYSDHDLNNPDDPLTCQRCFAFDESEATRRFIEAERLLLIAERVCAMTGWTASTNGSERDKALTELWMAWAKERPHLTGPKAWPDLDDDGIAALAAQRDATRTATLSRLGLTS